MFQNKFVYCELFTEQGWGALVPKEYFLHVIQGWLLKKMKEVLCIENMEDCKYKNWPMVDCGVLYIFNSIKKASKTSVCDAF